MSDNVRPARSAADIERLLARWPRRLTGTRPTPLHQLPRLSERLGREIWIKRDDLTGAAFGGNKVRKLEYLVADALAHGSRRLVSAGAAQSNHARTVAAVAAMENLRCDLFLGGTAPPRPTGNLVVSELCGASVHWVQTQAWPEIEATALAFCAAQPAEGDAYFIPIGGSVPLGVLGFVAAYVEFARQCADAGLKPGAVVHASSSGGTQAGLEIGRRLMGESVQIFGVRVAKTASELRQDVTALMDGTYRVLGIEVEPADPPIVVDNYSGDYAVATPAGSQALRLLARTEGIFLDPVYTAKAFASIVGDGLPGVDGPLVFWHTGGLPALFRDEGVD